MEVLSRWRWDAPPDWTVIRTIDAHAAGEPLRIVIGGFPPIPGKTMLEKRRYAREHLDDLRRALMWEPRGHADMYGCILTEPVSAGSHLGVLFLHNEGFSTMCGHGIIALGKVLFDTGIMKSEEENPVLKIDTPAGLVTARVRREGNKVREVNFRNVPSFVYLLDQEVDVPGLGKIRYDIAFGGAFYAFCKAEDMGFKLVPDEFRHLIRVGVRTKRAIMNAVPVRHPFEKDLGFLYGTVFTGRPVDPRNHSRNVCIFADGEVDRSPTGTGVSARVALHFTRRELEKEEPFKVESIIGTCFTGRVVDVMDFGPYKAVIPEITGEAHITGRSEFMIDPEDPLRHGFLLR